MGNCLTHYFNQLRGEREILESTDAKIRCMNHEQVMDYIIHESVTRHFDNLSPVAQLKVVTAWADLEDCYMLDSVRSASDLIKLYRFVHFEVRVEHIQQIYEKIDEELCYNCHTTQNQLKWFFKHIGYEII